MVTCYDYSSAKILAASSIDCILVGDSLAMTMYGSSSTLSATPSLIAQHIEAVRAGAPEKFIVGDMPFLAHRGDLNATMEAVRIIMKAGAQSVKIEGVDGAEDTIRHIIQSGVPVMGHLGLTPQSIHQLGGFKVQGKTPDASELLLSQARRLEELGVFCIVLECIPAEVATKVTSQLSIPTIGIGAGNQCSGQVLVWQDLLGMNRDFQPKFVRQYVDAYSIFREALDQFDKDVKSQKFPLENESY